MVTREQFIEATGQEPQQDDLDRCNCPLAGEIGHWSCGWNAQLRLPVLAIPLGLRLPVMMSAPSINAVRSQLGYPLLEGWR